jgi:DNA-binding transcriptional regulator GbsR (MarR family)
VTDLHPIVRRFIEDAGNLTQALGVGRVLGQIYAYLYFSPEPRNLGDMQRCLGISKGSASTGVRQLEQWGAVRKVWIRGDRKDYYEANDWLGRILKNAFADTAGKKLAAYSFLLDEVQGDLDHLASANGQGEFIKARIEHLRLFSARAHQFWNNPFLQTLLK